jgi:hypothetical protein
MRAWLFFLASLLAAPCWAAHGYALWDDLKYRAGFTAFDYVNVAAPRGGEAGLAGLWIGLAMVLAPLKVLADVVPPLGRLAGVGVGLVALLVAAVVGMLTVSVAWLAYRPLVGIVLIVAAGGLLLVMRHLAKRRAAMRPALLRHAAIAPPPPPPPVPAAS